MAYPDNFRASVRIVMHLNGGFTQLLHRGATLEIPTRLIPPNLRAVGTEFILASDEPQIQPQPKTEDEARARSSWSNFYVLCNDR
jgi:hypothetical protein